LLSYILLRRTQDSVLGSILPPRTDYTIQCYLQKEQKELYIDESKKILDNLLNEQSRQINNTDKNKSTMNGVLSQLLKLRLICNNSSNDSNSDNSISSKLSVLEKMLLSVKSIGSEKVVVVSNFMSTLDQIFSIGKSHKWSMLRLDGSVQPEKRMKIVRLDCSLADDVPTAG
jgi:SNF2 family DNA or RNA helicase